MKGNFYIPAGLYCVCVVFFLFTGTSFLRAQNSCVSPPSGLVAWWRAEGNANDSGGTNNGTVLNGGGYTNGEVGQAFSLEGTNAGVEIPASSSLDVGTGNGMTIEGWINPSAINDERTIFEWNNGSQWGANFDFSTPPGAGPYGTGPGCLFVNLVDTNGNYHWLSSPAGIVQTDVFQHVAFTYDKSSGLAVLYLNGVIVATSNLGNNFTAQTSYDAYLGVRINNPPVASQWAGMDEMSLYNRALSSNEIAAVYNAGSAGKCVAMGSPCDPAPSGVVSWWPAEGNANDIVGTNNGNLQNITYTNGEVGQAFAFNGSNSQIDVPASPSLNVGLDNGFTVETWINPASLNFQEICEWNQNVGGSVGSSQIGAHMEINESPGDGSLVGNIVDTNANSHSIYSAPNIIVANTFQHIAMTYDKTSGVAALYHNGVAVATANLGSFTPQTSFDLFLGNRPSGFFAGNYFQGEMDEPTIYNHALSSNEIAAIYDAGNDGKCAGMGPCDPEPSGIVSWWPAEDNANDIIGTNDGITQNIVYTNGEVGQAFAFNGSSSEIDVPANSSLNVGLSSGLTIEAWISPANYNLGIPIELVGWYDNAGDFGTLMWLSTDHGSSGDGYRNLYANLVDTTGNSHTIYSAAGLMTSNEFQHVALTYDKTTGTAVLYRNGVLVQTANLGIFTPQTGFDFSMGNKPTGSFAGNYFQGEVDELTIYNRALSSNEITAIYDAGSVGKCMTPTPPSIFLQPTNQTNTLGGTSMFTVGASGTTPLIYQWYFNTTNLLEGATNASLVLANVQFHQAGNYTVLVTNTYGSIISSNAALTILLPIAPTVTNQPASQNVTAGANVTFTVGVSGTSPLSYQWLFNNTNIITATNASLILNNVQVSQSGNYSVMVTNLGGSTLSSNAVLTVNYPPATVQVVGTNSPNAPAPSGTIKVPIQILANGNEYALSFSLSWNPVAALSFAGVALGSGDGNASLIVNTNQVSSGKLGLQLIMPWPATFVAGTQEVAEVMLNISNILTTLSASIGFGDQPVVRQLSDVEGNSLAVNFVNGSLFFAPATSLEADVSPRPGGNRSLALTDWILMGRYAARLDYPTNTSEFQRADCAPRSTLGDGHIAVTDWVQAGRFADALDPLSPAGGPTNEVSSAGAGPSLARWLEVADATLTQGQPGIISVTLNSQGNENALGFTLVFDPALLSFESVDLGSDDSGATLLVNTNQIANGQLGIALALPIGTSFAAGTREILQLNMLAASSGNGLMSFSDQPVLREISDIMGNALPASYSSGSITSHPLQPALEIWPSGTNVVLSWPLWATGFDLQSVDGLTSSNGWSNIAPTLQMNISNISVMLPASGNAQFYRLYHP
jgi:Concanavalin A-like lectin/glucanases superfamily/Immunoglobulin domain